MTELLKHPVRLNSVTGMLTPDNFLLSDLPGSENSNLRGLFRKAPGNSLSFSSAVLDERLLRFGCMVDAYGSRKWPHREPVGFIPTRKVGLFGAINSNR